MNKILISTMLKFVLYDGKPIILHEGDLSLGTAHYNGITWNENNIFVSASVDAKYIIHKFDKSLELVDTLSEADLHETHQIFWQNNKLYVTNTGLNRIEILENGNWSSIAWKHARYDIDHINGIWINDKRFYITEFRRRTEGAPPSIIRICDNDFNTLEEITVNRGKGIHNIYHENNTLYTLISSPPQIIEYNLISKKFSAFNLDVKDALIRGIARTINYWYIGVSRWEMERDKRHVGDAIVLQLDNEFNEVNRITMPDFGPVCDIRVIDELDLAHNGILF